MLTMSLRSQIPARASLQLHVAPQLQMSMRSLHSSVSSVMAQLFIEPATTLGLKLSTKAAQRLSVAN